MMLIFSDNVGRVEIDINQVFMEIVISNRFTKNKHISKYLGT